MCLVCHTLLQVTPKTFLKGKLGKIRAVFLVWNPALLFLIYASDCRLLQRLAGLPGSIFIDPTANYTEFKGAMAENAVLQSLLPSYASMPYYWSSEGKAEIEFLLQHENEIIPVEVKTENCVSGRSIVVYNERYQPKNRIRFSTYSKIAVCWLAHRLWQNGI